MNARQLAIMQLMDARRKFTARELAERFGVSIRTIQRDLNELQTVGFPLYAETGAHGGYYVLPHRMLPPLQLTPNEALGLFLMLEYLKQVPDFPYGGIRAYLAEHYFGSLPPDVRDLITQSSEHIRFLLEPGEASEAVTTTILQAAIARRAIQFSYLAKGGTKQVEAFPIGLYFSNGFWYMPARKEAHIRLYRTDRMTGVEAGEQEDRDGPNLQQWLRAGEQRPGRTVTLTFTEEGRRLAQSQLWEPALTDRRWTGEVPEEEFSFFSRRLLAYGVEVKVEQPLALRQMVYDLLKQAVAQYE